MIYMMYMIYMILYYLYDLFETNNVSWFYKGFKILFGVKVNLCSNSAQLLAAGFL